MIMWVSVLTNLTAVWYCIGDVALTPMTVWKLQAVTHNTESVVWDCVARYTESVIWGSRLKPGGPHWTETLCVQPFSCYWRPDGRREPVKDDFCWRLCVQAKNVEFFSQYVTEDFKTYLNRKRMDSCHGNHLEIQAMAELFNRPVEVYQYSIGKFPPAVISMLCLKPEVGLGPAEILCVQRFFCIHTRHEYMKHPSPYILCMNTQSVFQHL